MKVTFTGHLWKRRMSFWTQFDSDQSVKWRKRKPWTHPSRHKCITEIRHVQMRIFWWISSYGEGNHHVLSFSFHSYFLRSFELVEPQDQALMTLINLCMNTHGALGDLVIIPPIPSLKPPEINRGRQIMTHRTKTRITFGARASSYFLILSQQLGALAPKVMEEIKKYDD